ncbi:MAG: biosynthetic arginine decarboxylase [Deltaproteobacteria bacterium]|nr:biosynthetic arginine decarboxylase [Deltaproteobacteria bacterium]
MKVWSIEDSLKTYNIENWGLHYFGINTKGNLTVHPKQSSGPAIDMKVVIDDIVSRGIKLPALVRFQDILRHRVVTLNEAFKKAIEENGYKGRYQGVYPIKVNQLREVVEEILDAGMPYQHGLEAGSKAELLASIAMNTNPDSLILCNGYKDYSVIKTALQGLKLGKKVIIIVEKLSELTQMLKVAKEIGVRPLIGIRSKLQTRGSGKWESSGGDFAKFGLTTPEILQAIKTLKDEGMVDCVKLVHFHIGSQITDIRTIKDAAKEGSRVYCKLRKMGVDIEYMDVGGGLGVDYDGSRTSFNSSINYSLQEYVSDIVYTIQEVCAAEEVPEPNIVSESGRALVAHHSMLIINVFGSIEVGATPYQLEESADENDVVREMREVLSNVSPKNLLETYHDALQRKEEAFSMFKLGFLDLEDKAKVENLFWKTCLSVAKLTAGAKYVPEDLGNMVKHLSDQYLCNFSVFQSAPDHWAIQHLFPIAPLHRLNEEPSRHSTLVDITCDSDGKVDKFIDLKDVKDTLPLHTLNGQPYYLGMFLMGAYQDIMGDVHNLFGRVNEVHVFEDAEEPGGYYIEETITGHTVGGILSTIQYSPAELAKMVKLSIDAQVKSGALKPREGVDLLNDYEQRLNEYTYIDSSS